MAIVRSMPRLMDVVLLLIFFYMFYGIITLELFGLGALRGRCGYPVFDNSSSVLQKDGQILLTGTSTYSQARYFLKHSNWLSFGLSGVSYTFPDDQLGLLCRRPSADAINWYNTTGTPTASGVRSGTGRDCPSNTDGLYPYGLYCAPYGNPGTPGGFQHFDNFAYGSLTMFLFISLQDWSVVMYNTQVWTKCREVSSKCGERNLLV
jgi:hypothetical protein